MSHHTRELIANSPGGPIPLWIVISALILFVVLPVVFGLWMLRKP